MQGIKEEMGMHGGASRMTEEKSRDTSSPVWALSDECSISELSHRFLLGDEVPGWS